MQGNATDIHELEQLPPLIVIRKLQDCPVLQHDIVQPVLIANCSSLFHRYTDQAAVGLCPRSNSDLAPVGHGLSIIE